MYEAAINKEADRRAQETANKKDTEDKKNNILSGLLSGTNRRTIGGK